MRWNASAANSVTRMGVDGLVPSPIVPTDVINRSRHSDSHGDAAVTRQAVALLLAACGDPAESVFVDRMIKVFAAFAPFHLCKCDHAIAPRDQINLTKRGLHAFGQDLPTLQAQEHGCAKLALPPRPLRVRPPESPSWPVDSPGIAPYS